MTIDISALNATELEELGAAVTKRRAELEPAISMQPPAQCEAVLNPAWHTAPLPNGVLFMLRHPGAGWLGFALPHEHRVHLATLWLHQALLYRPVEATAPAEDTPTPATPTFGTGGSGSVH